MNVNEDPDTVVDAPDDDEKEDLPLADDAEVLQGERALIEEDEEDGLRLSGFPDEEIPEILDAMGDDAAEVLPDSPTGTSATGAWSQPEHGGFPERD